MAPLLESPALQIILQHDHITQQPALVCRLLCTSKAAAAAVLLHCRGELSLTFDFESCHLTQQACAWLARKAAVAMKLKVHMHPEYEEDHHRRLQELQQHSN
jgi:hypothetical protein